MPSPFSVRQRGAVVAMLSPDYLVHAQFGFRLFEALFYSPPQAT
jgi:hypothetical protein